MPTAISSCISSPEHNPEDNKWYRGIYSLRMGGSEFIKGDTQLPTAKVGLAEAKSVPFCSISFAITYLFLLSLRELRLRDKYGLDSIIALS